MARGDLLSAGMGVWLARAALTVALLGAPIAAHAVEPVRRIAIYVQPFYQAANTPGEAPRVAVGQRFDTLLASPRREDILAARDMIAADPKVVTPMTLMVLAIRLYDVGMRDEAVFWFYAAKDRFITFAEVVDTNAQVLMQVDEAMRSFSAIAGPVINGYAFCDLANQKALRAKALAWVEANPYAATFMSQLPARTNDRQAGLSRAVRNAKAGAAKEAAYFDDPKNTETFFATRRKNEADAKYCWK